MTKLKHVGVPGMKWGVRRGRTDTSSSDYKTARSIKKKKIREMTNDEIKTLSTRIRLEKDLKLIKPSTVEKGAKAVDSVISTIGKLGAAATTLAALSAGVKKAVEVYKKTKG